MGAYYWPAKLRDVGTYLFIWHHIGEEKCETLKRWCNILDSAELSKDRIEQEALQQFIFSVGLEPVLVPDLDPYAEYFQNRDFDMDKDNNLDDDLIDYEGDDLGDGDEEMEDKNPHFPIAGASADRECHGLPWGFSGQPVPVPVKTRTRTQGYGY